jgi:ABC-2 type transport system ATP-binding protein
MAFAVETATLSKNYSGENALKSVSFKVNCGILYGIIGADGAGKTTLMRILSTLLSADKGEAVVLGKSVIHDFQKIRSEIGYMPQRFSLYQDLSVIENLIFFADVYGVKRREREERLKRLLSFSRLDQFQSRRAAHLSGGMKQKLALSCALIHTPQVLLLDEPTTGVDPVSRKEFWDILKELRNQGITIIVTTPYMDEAQICDSLLVLHKGEVLREGSPKNLLSSYPYDIYKVWNDNLTITCKRDDSYPDGFLTAYPFAGSVHVVVKDKRLSAEKISEGIKKIQPDSDRMEKVEPEIEDLFFMLISEREGSAGV